MMDLWDQLCSNNIWIWWMNEWMVCVRIYGVIMFVYCLMSVIEELSSNVLLIRPFHAVTWSFFNSRNLSLVRHKFLAVLWREHQNQLMIVTPRWLRTADVPEVETAPVLDSLLSLSLNVTSWVGKGRAIRSSVCFEDVLTNWNGFSVGREPSSSEWIVDSLWIIRTRTVH